MKRSITMSVIVLMLALVTTTNGQMTSADFLKASGTVLRNNSGTGDTINLRGTNLGSWLSMEYWMGPVGKGSLNRSQWVGTGSTTQNGTNPQNVFDRNLGTRWSNGQKQKPNGSQYFIVDMQDTVLFNRVSFEAGDFTNEYPDSYDIEVSNDGSTWELVASGAGEPGGSFVQLPNIYSKRYVKITQTGRSNQNWSIAEFNLYMEDDFRVRNSLILRFGEDGMDSLLDYFQNAWITETDLDTIQAMGMNMVRVPFFWMEIMYNDGTIKPHGFDQLDWVISECAERNMYVILDLHGAPGGLNGFITSGQAVTNDLWTDPVAQQRTIDIWKALAARYKDNPTVAGYDLMNEPLSSDQQTYPIHGFYDVLYDEVRAIDPDHLIIIGAFPGFNQVVDPAYYGWTNVMYQVHHYNEDKTNYASQNGFIEAVHRDVATHMYKWNVPVYAGEFNFWDFPDLWEKYITGLNYMNVSWSNWAYKVKRIDQPKENWGYYDSIPLPIPDIHYDSFDSIAYKWSQFTTDNARENTELKSIIRPLTDVPVTGSPVGEVIWLQGSNGKYVSSEGNTNPMTCNRDNYDGWELFEVVDAGNGKVALLGSNNYYVNSQNGQNAMMCNTTAIGDWEKFSFIRLSESKVALFGNNERFVSSEDGLTPMNCNRESIGGWEIFSWGVNQSGSRVAEIESVTKEPEVAVFPNPTANLLTIQMNTEGFEMEIIDTSGRSLLRQRVDGSTNQVNVSSLQPGLYFIKLRTEEQELTKRLVIKE